MIIAIFGESCTGKSTLAAALKDKLAARIMSGKDYLRFGKSEQESKKLFEKLLSDKEDSPDTLIYVISETEQLAFLPKSAKRVLVTAELDTIKERFTRRTGGRLPPPVATMLERKHGAFDAVPCDVHVISGEGSADELCGKIMAIL